MDGGAAVRQSAQRNGRHHGVFRPGPRLGYQRKPFARSEPTSLARLDDHAARRLRLAPHWMSARGLWIVALAAALAVLAAANVLRSRQQGGTGDEVAPRPSIVRNAESSERSRAAEQVAEE